MDLSAITVASLLMMFYGCFAAKEKNRYGLDLDLDPSEGLFVGYGSDNCCRRIDNQAAVLRGISSATEKLTKDVGEMKTGVKDDIPSELKRQAVDLGKLSSDMKKQAVDQEKLSSELKSEFKRQTVDQEKLSSELKGVKASVSDLSINLNKNTEVLVAHDRRMNELRLLLEKINSVVQEIHGSLTAKPKDCSDIRARGQSTSGVYRVYPGNQVKRIQADVYCDLTTPGGNWLVFQRRRDGSVAFERTWNEYLNGFGNPSGEFWLGNEALYLLTSNGRYKLRIDMEDFDGNKRYAEYSTFSVGSSTDKYRLTVTGYTGNAGDSLYYQNGAQFSTKDADNDSYGTSCSQQFRGAWWYKSCIHSNLNGLYLRGQSGAYGIGWNTFRGLQYSLKMTEMKIAAVN